MTKYWIEVINEISGKTLGYVTSTNKKEAIQAAKWEYREYNIDGKYSVYVWRTDKDRPDEPASHWDPVWYKQNQAT